MPVQSDWPRTARLWLVLDRHACHPRSLEATAQLAIAGGVEAVLFRVKDLPHAEVRRLARPVRNVCRDYEIPFVMSHDLQLAVELNSDGIQLGIGDPELSRVKRALRPGTVIGCSTHNVNEARERIGEGADYVFLGPVFPTPAKLKYGAPLGIEIVRQAAMEITQAPLVFIGGINQGNLGLILECGGRRVAAIAALQAVPSPEDAACAFKALLNAYTIS